MLRVRSTRSIGMRRDHSAQLLGRGEGGRGGNLGGTEHSDSAVMERRIGRVSSLWHGAIQCLRTE